MITAFCLAFPMGNSPEGALYQYQVDFCGEDAGGVNSDTFEVRFDLDDTPDTFRQKVVDLALLRANVYGYAVAPERVFVQVQYT